MTTAAPARRLDQPKGTARHGQERTSRLRRWWRGWRLALRMARRDVRRDWGRNLFIWLMIVVPITAICAIQVIAASSVLSGTEALDLDLGTAEAVLTHTDDAFTPAFDGYGSATPGSEDPRPATPIPGWGPTVVEQERAVAALLARPVVATTLASWTLATDDSWLMSYGADLRHPIVGGFVQHTGGRLPATELEALVTPVGISDGLPASGPVTLVSETTGKETTFTIVGTASVARQGDAGLVTLPDRSLEAGSFLVPGPEPVDWALAQQLAGYGIQTTSRSIAANPPYLVSDPSEVMRTLLIELLVAAALLEVALVVGPAFAIGAARQRRSLALAASNGASAAQLRRSALGQALLVGSTATIIGGVLGTGIGVALWQSGWFDQPHHMRLPLDVPYWQLGITLILGLLTAVVAALVPARGLGRMDLVASLRGSLRSPKPRRGAPLVGAALIALGAIAVYLPSQALADWVFWAWFLGVLSVVIGVLLATPGFLVLAARLASPLPMSARMALRDGARQRGRAASTVAAVLGGTLVLTATWTLVLSAEAVTARGYQYQLPLGQARIWPDGKAAADKIHALVRAVDPDLHIVDLGRIEGWAGNGEVATIGALRPGCTPAEVAEFIETCNSLFSSGRGYGSGILAGSAADLTTWFGLSTQEQSALNAGQILVNTDSPGGDAYWAQHDIVGGQVRFAYLFEDGEADAQVVSVPASAITKEVISRAASPQDFGALISTEAATELGWVSSPFVQIRDPRGPISPDTEAALTTALVEISPFAQVYVERGYQPDHQLLLWAVTGTLMLLAVVAALIASIMSTLELRPFLGTFAAVGAGQGLSRRLAVVQAGFLALFGTVLGVGVGVGVAIPMALRLAGETGGAGTLPTLVVPWAVMATLVLVIPLVAATIAAVTVPARPVLTRRPS